MDAPLARDVPIKTLLLRTVAPAIAVVALALGALVYSRLYDVILDGFARKLVTTSALTGALIDPADHDFLLDAALARTAPGLVEQTPQYVRNVQPMRHIRERLGLTYLYTQAIGGDKDIVYVLDGTVGSEHSTIGSEDVLPPQTMAGLRQTSATGAIYVSPVEFQEQWGLLKTAAAPVRGRDGQIKATAGADVNISVIQVATQNALFASAMIGLASLIACGVVTLLIVRRVAAPIEQLKADALRIAAGGRAPPSESPAPREVVGLRKALGELARDLLEQMRAGRAETLAYDRDRNLELIESVLPPSEPTGAVTLVDTPDTLVIWTAADGCGAQAALRRRAMALLAHRITAEPTLASEWTDLVDIGRDAWVVADRRAGRVQALGAEGLKLRSRAGELELAPGEGLILAQHPGLVLVLEAGEIALEGEGRP
jgi:hypothetical protein